MTFDLDTGLFKLPPFDAANSDDLWLALADVRGKLRKVKSLSIEPGDKTKLELGRVLWVGSEQAPEQFKLFVESL